MLCRCVLLRSLFVAVVSTVAGSGTPTYVDATGIAAGFKDPVALVLDTIGNIYVSDYVNQRIRKVSPTGGTRTASSCGCPSERVVMPQECLCVHCVDFMRVFRMCDDVFCRVHLAVWSS